MSDKPAEPLGAGIVYDGPLPLRWTPAAEWNADRLAYAGEQNERVLQALRVLDEYAVEHGEEVGAAAQELARLDAKLNLMLDLMNQLLVRHLDLPAPVAVALDARGVVWASPRPPRVEDDIVIELYLNVRYPVPLVLEAHIVEVGGDAAKDKPARVEARFEHVKENVVEWLERIIFRHHRRRVAEARRGVT